ncbi:MAG: carbohydrate kinase family protein [Candidatus Thorarchaeota archaeon]
MSVEVVSIGRTNIDIVMNVKELPKPNEHVFSEQSSFSFGGSAANFAAQSAKLGVKTGLISCVGTDLYGQLALKNLQDIGVDSKAILILDNQPTGLFFLAQTPSKESVIFAEPGANRFLERHVIDDEYLHRARTIHIAGGYPMLMPRVIEFATTNGMVVSIDPGRASEGVDFKKILRSTDLLFVNESELQAYFGISSSEKDLRMFAKTFPGIVVVKMGNQGSIATDGFEYITSPIFEVPVVDTLGAGDSFAAAFVTAWTRSENITQALNFANAAAAQTIKVQGAQNGQPSLQEVASLLKVHDIDIHSILRTFRDKR